MELEQLRYFIQIADRGSFSRAAAMLGVTQPFLSRQIRRLEVEMHRHLFFRHGRGISLTEAGESFLITARSVIDQLDLASRSPATPEGTLTGRFTLGLTPSLARILTVPLLRAFTARFPQAQMSVVEGLSISLHERLLAGRVDAAVLHDHPPSALIQTEALATRPLCLIARRDDPQKEPRQIRFSELTRHPLIFPSAPHPLRAIVEAEAARRQLELNVVHEIDGVETLLELVLEGFGANVAPAHVVRTGHWNAGLVAIPIVEPELATTMSLATAKRHAPTLLYRACLGLTQEVFARVLHT